MSEFFTGSSNSPQPSFTYSPSSPQTSQTVTFTGTVSGGTPPYSYSWNFGDGSTGTGSSATHSFGTAGSYTVTLSVNDTAKKTGSTSQTISVTRPPTPDFTISANPSSLTLQNGTSSPSTITVSSTGGFSGSVSLTASTVSGISTAFNPSSLSPSAGGSASSTLTFSATSSASAGTYSFAITGVSGSISHATQVSVTVTSQPPLSASFTYSPNNPQTGQTIMFTGTASGGTAPYSYSWNFGDGSTGTGNSPTYVYNTAGSYSVALNVQDSASSTGSTGQTVTVTQAPTPDFTINANPSGLTVQAGNSNSLTITVTPVNGFSNDVALTVSFSSSGPSGSFNPATIIGGSGTSTLAISTSGSTTAGSYQVTVTGSSPIVAKSVTLTLTVTTTQNNPPVVTVLGPLTAATGSAVTLKASASDPDPGETIVLGASGLPAGATFDPNTGILNWKPASNQVGSYTITFTATDNGTPPLTSSQPVTLQITSPTSGGCGNNCSSFPIPSTGIWLVGLGGLFSLVASLVVLNLRGKSRLRQARKLNRLDD